MKVTPGFDPNSKKIKLEFKTNLLKKYYSNFAGMISNDSNIPNGTNIEQVGDDTAVISFPLPKNSQIKNDDERGIGFIAVDPKSMEIFSEVINRFVNAALRKEFRTTEFIPLEGYPISNLKEEIKEAIKNKRNFCIIDTYENYKRLKEINYEFKQAYVNFGTSDYSKTAVLIHRLDIEGLKKMWSEKLSIGNWN